jgi:3-oxoadipate enol-lactonase
MKTAANGIEIDYRTDGREGAPWITFITGITNNVSMWDAHVAALARDFRLLRYDSRGHGGTTATAPPYTLDRLAADTVGLWDALGVEKSYLVGIGLGGMTAMTVALARPDRVAGLVPVACRAALTPDYKAIWPPVIEIAGRDGVEGIVERTVERWFPEPFRAAHPDVMDRVRAMIRTTSLDGYLGCIAALLGLDLQHRLGELRLPVLFVSGALDRLGGPPMVMQEMCDLVLGARHVTLPEAGHICTIANPEAFDAALLGFLAPG